MEKTILVVSDTHGQKNLLETLIEKQSYDLVFFLGDGVRDFNDIEEDNILKVQGNCDLFCDEPIYRIEIINGIKILLCHGHTFFVKYDIYSLLNKAKQLGCRFVFYGHTHRQFMETIDGITLINPGSFACGNYAIFKLLSNGEFEVQFFKD